MSAASSSYDEDDDEHGDDDDLASGVAEEVAFTHLQLRVVAGLAVLKES